MVELVNVTVKECMEFGVEMIDESRLTIYGSDIVENDGVGVRGSSGHLEIEESRIDANKVWSTLNFMLD